MKNVLLAGIFLLPVLGGVHMEGELRRRWSLLESLRRQTAGTILRLENSRRPLQRETEALRQGALDQRLKERERAVLGSFAERMETASREELLLLGREAKGVLEEAALEAEQIFKSRGRLWKVLGLVWGSGAVLLLL